MLLCTLKSSLAMFLLFFFLDMNYLLLGIANIQCGSSGEIMATVQKAGGVFGILAAFAAWYNAFAGIFDKSNGFFTVPLGHFPWSPIIHAHQSKFKEVWAYTKSWIFGQTQHFIHWPKGHSIQAKNTMFPPPLSNHFRGLPANYEVFLHYPGLTPHFGPAISASLSL